LSADSSYCLGQVASFRFDSLAPLIDAALRGALIVEPRTTWPCVQVAPWPWPGGVGYCAMAEATVKKSVGIASSSRQVIAIGRSPVCET